MCLKIPSKVLSLLVLTILALPTALQAVELEGELLYSDGFENGWETGWRLQTADPSNIQITKTVPARAGQHAVRFTVKRDEASVAKGQRSELFAPKGSTYWGQGDAYEIAASILFPSDYVDDPAQEIIWQIHGDSNQPSVPFLIQSVGDGLLIKGKGIQQTKIPKTKGRWMDIRTRHIFSAAGKGSTQVFVNGQKVVDARSIANIGANQKVYWKFGIYKTGWKRGGQTSITRERTLYFDEVRIRRLNMRE